MRSQPTILASHHPLTDYFLAGDFTAHLSNWYGEWNTQYSEAIRWRRRTTQPLIEWTTQANLVLVNIPVTFTHFPRMPKYRPTTPDYTFVRNQAHTVHQGWKTDPDGRGDVDHTFITSMLGIKPLAFIPEFQHHLRNQETFR